MRTSQICEMTIGFFMKENIWSITPGELGISGQPNLVSAVNSLERRGWLLVARSEDGERIELFELTKAGAHELERRKKASKAG